MNAVSPPTWRVYVKEWIIVYTSDALGEDGSAETGKFLDETYHGRLDSADVSSAAVFPAVADDGHRDWDRPAPAVGSVRIWNLRGEWKDREFADADVQRIHDTEGVDPAVVGTGTPEEQALLDYGKRMLPA